MSPRVRARVRASLGAAALLTALSPIAAPVGAGTATPNDPVFSQGLQWGLGRIAAPAAWPSGTGRGITIAVVDSGVDLAHEDLAAKLVAQVSCIGSNGNASACSGSAQDDNGHGTHVAGIALAATNNGKGVAGVAPDARLMAVRVLENQCGAGGCTASGSSNDVAAGIRWAADHGANVINLSLGGGAVQGVLGCSFCDAVEYAWGKGALVVIAAGNDSVLPAGFGNEHALVVTATTRDDTRASYSNASSGFIRAARWPVAAPGGEPESAASDCATGGRPKGVLSTYWVSGKANRYACLAGTSMAAPHVSGALAVLLGSGRSPQAAVDRLLATAEDLGPQGRDDSFGFGRIDLARAVGGSTPGTPTTPTTPDPGTTEPDTTAGAVAVESSVVDPSSTAPGSVPTSEVPVNIPEVAEPVPFKPAAPSDPDSEVPGWLVGIAVLALLASATATATTAWRLGSR